MNQNDLMENIEVECENLEKIIFEINQLKKDLNERTPNIVEKAAISHFLMSIYNGIENIFKNLCKYYGVSLPRGEFYHIEILKYFCSPIDKTLPLLITDNIISYIQELRKFRHVVRQGYAHQPEWDRMQPIVETIEYTFGEFKRNLEDCLEILKKKNNNIS